MDNSVVTMSGFFNADSLTHGEVINEFAQAGSVNMGMFLSKVSTGGDPNWIIAMNNTYLSYPEDFKVNEIGQIFLGGQFRGTLSMIDSSFSNDGLGQSYFIFKFDLNGDLIWAMSGFESGNGLARFDVDGSDLWAIISFTGTFQFNGTEYQADMSLGANQRDFLLVHLAEDGSVSYTHHISGNGTGVIRDLEVIGDKVIIQGVFTDEMTIGSATLVASSPNEYHAFHVAFNTVELDMDWQLVSTSSALSSVNYQPRYIIAYDQNLLISAGTFASHDLQYGNLTISPQEIDGYVMGLDPSDGEVLWLKRLGAEGNDEITDIVRTAAGAAIVGYFRSGELMVNGSTVTNTTTNGMADPFLILIDSDGKLQCSKESLGAEGDELGFGLVHGSDGLFALFSFNGIFTVDEHMHSAEGLRDLLVTKTCLPCDTLTGITETTTAQPALHLYPNPASQSVRVNVQSSKFEVQSLEVIDMLGNRVLNLKPETLNSELDISRLAGGIYTVAAQGRDREVLRARLVVQH